MNYKSERIAMLRFFIAIHGLSKRTLGSGDFTAMAVEWIVALGHLEGKTFNASKVSSYLGIPRSTVIRKLRWLVKNGFIEERNHHYSLSPKYLDMPAEEYQQIATAIHHLTDLVPLPKMDAVQPGHTGEERQLKSAS